MVDPTPMMSMKRGQFETEMKNQIKNQGQASQEKHRRVFSMTNSTTNNGAAAPSENTFETNVNGIYNMGTKTS
jgi:hypothetical protein